MSWIRNERAGRWIRAERGQVRSQMGQRSWRHTRGATFQIASIFLELKEREKAHRAIDRREHNVPSPRGKRVPQIAQKELGTQRSAIEMSKRCLTLRGKKWSRREMRWYRAFFSWKKRGKSRMFRRMLVLGWICFSFEICGSLQTDFDGLGFRVCVCGGGVFFFWIVWSFERDFEFLFFETLQFVWRILVVDFILGFVILLRYLSIAFLILSCNFWIFRIWILFLEFFENCFIEFYYTRNIYYIQNFDR